MADVRALNDDRFRLYRYHVFLSFRGEGTGKSFTDDLYKALVGEGFRTFRHDAEIERGEDIRSELEKTIKQSMISIIVLSKDYTSSFRCLDELATIVECKKKFGQVVLPVFYDVSPSQVRKQKGSIAKAFAYCELGTDREMKKGSKIYNLIGWREALREVSRLLPRVLQNQSDGHESKLIQKTVEEIEDKVKAVRKDFVPMRAETEVELWNQIRNCLPSLFLESMHVLQDLDLSNTSINSLPPSISHLFTLRGFYLRGCELLMELPPEIGALRNLKVFDLEGTEVICLPKEIGGLLKLECLKVSLYECADQYRERKGIEAIIPRATLSKFSHLKELSIDVDPGCGWWDVEVETIINELSKLGNLETLKLYLPTVELLQQFLQLPLNMSMMYPTLSHFRLIVGRHEQRIISHLPRDLQDNFEKLNRCLKYVNGEGYNDGIAAALKQATALFLDRHWTIDRLSAFKIDEMDKLNFCLLVECNEMKNIVDGGVFYQQEDKNYGGKPILRSLQYLSIHYMKNLECIWKGPIVTGCLSYLKILALHSCPKLSTIFNLGLLGNLVNLKELIVEDCPKIKSLVSLESSLLEYNHFLLNLKKISLLHLPELVSIASGLCIAPKLERMIIYNCPKLKILSTIEMSSEDMKEIKGESAWWEALEWHRSEWSSDQTDYLASVFVPLGSDDDLMDQLAEAVETSLNSQVVEEVY